MADRDNLVPVQSTAINGAEHVRSAEKAPAPAWQQNVDLSV
jgi:hypothetical protein